MPEMRTIEIDFDIHKLIETERRSFAEAPYMVLRRLLKLGEVKDAPSNRDHIYADSGAWNGKGVSLLSGTKLRMSYRGSQYFGTIQKSAWVVEGRKFNSPSAAAGGVARTKDGKSPSLDGWRYWYVKRPGDPGWIPLDTLRRRVGDE